MFHLTNIKLTLFNPGNIKSISYNRHIEFHIINNVSSSKQKWSNLMTQSCIQNACTKISNTNMIVAYKKTCI